MIWGQVDLTESDKTKTALSRRDRERVLRCKGRRGSVRSG